MVPVDWVLAVIVTLFKGKGDALECENFRGSSLLSVINRIRDETEKAILEVQWLKKREGMCRPNFYR